ncbi:hypothetical protein HK104_010183, partial [Borealophlyctis nickersoniae]
LIITAAAYLVVNLIRLIGVTLVKANNVEVENNLHARIAHTQVTVFKRVCYAFVVIIWLACIVSVFPTAWQIGASLLASAGVLGIIAGIAAKPMLENLLASLMLVLTRPILLDDEVIVAGEYGRIESITSMYVVLRTWDSRRLILPLSHFTSSPFENWSRRSTWRIGSVFLYLSPLTPIPLIRSIFLDEVLPASGGLWDGKVANVAVTDCVKDGAAGGAVEVRFLCSARDGSKCFDLRCFVREKMVEIVRERIPGALMCQHVKAHVVTEDSSPAYSHSFRSTRRGTDESGKTHVDEGDPLMGHGFTGNPLTRSPVKEKESPEVLAARARTIKARELMEETVMDGLAKGNLGDDGHG